MKSEVLRQWANDIRGICSGGDIETLTAADRRIATTNFRIAKVIEYLADHLDEHQELCDSAVSDMTRDPDKHVPRPPTAQELREREQGRFRRRRETMLEKELAEAVAAKEKAEADAKAKDGQIFALDHYADGETRRADALAARLREAKELLSRWIARAHLDQPTQDVANATEAFLASAEREEPQADAEPAQPPAFSEEQIERVREIASHLTRGTACLDHGMIVEDQDGPWVLVSQLCAALRGEEANS